MVLGPCMQITGPKGRFFLQSSRHSFTNVVVMQRKTRGSFGFGWQWVNKVKVLYLRKSKYVHCEVVIPLSYHTLALLGYFKDLWLVMPWYFFPFAIFQSPPGSSSGCRSRYCLLPRGSFPAVMFGCLGGYCVALTEQWLCSRTMLSTCLNCFIYYSQYFKYSFHAGLEIDPRTEWVSDVAVSEVVLLAPAWFPTCLLPHHCQ